MTVINYTEFRRNLANSLDRASDDAEIVIVSRRKGKNVVVMDLDQYNSMTKTLYITNSETNSERLQHAVDEMNSGVHFSHKLIED